MSDIIKLILQQDDIFITGLMGLSLRIFLSVFDQKWVNTFQYLLTFIILPVIAFVITKVIAGNIALALGMVGALSIVRFRNPVKNTFELVMYFALLTIGISNSISLKYGLGLTLFIILTLILSFYFDKITKKKGINFFSVSFSEGQRNHLLEIISNKNLEENFGKKFLLELNKDFENSEFSYKFVSYKIDDLNKISEFYEKKYTTFIKSVNINNIV